MLKILAIIIELFAFIFVLWVLTLLSTLLHEFGHAIGYMLATGDRHWHIRVGWGKRLLNPKMPKKQKINVMVNTVLERFKNFLILLVLSNHLILFYYY